MQRTPLSRLLRLGRGMKRRIRMKNTISVIDRWEGNEGSGDTYIEFRIGKDGACCVEKTGNGLVYVMECADGNEVYSYAVGADYPLRKLTDEEREEVVSIARRETASD